MGSAAKGSRTVMVAVGEQAKIGAAAPTSSERGRRVAIEACNLHKTYRGGKAVGGVSFAVLRGEIFGILGPNGAGKSTTLELIEGLREPDHQPGTTIAVDGLNMLERRPR